MPTSLRFGKTSNNQHPFKKSKALKPLDVERWMFDVRCFPLFHAVPEAGAPSNGTLPAAVRARAVQINQNVARLGAFAGADDAAIFQFVHDARRPRVAEAQPPLHQRDARLLFAADDFDALLDEILVLVNAAFVPEIGGGLGKLLVNFQVVVRFALLGNELDDAVDFLVGDERALGANRSEERRV